MEYFITTHNNGGFTIGEVSHKSFESIWVNIKIIIPFSGNSVAMKDYYTKGRIFQTTYGNNKWSYGESFFCTKESHPEYFI